MTEKRFEHKWNMLGMQFICYDDKEVLIGTFADKEGLSQITELLNNLNDENEQLKHDATVLIQANQDYRRENVQLKQRNNRQAKQLDHLYNLIEEKDWRTLSDILDDFKRCEEQLHKEWRTYGDVE